MRIGYLAWPEGQPEKVRFAGTWIGQWWNMVGPMGWRAMLAGRRMTSFGPLLEIEDHERYARVLDAEIARR